MQTYKAMRIGEQIIPIGDINSEKEKAIEALKAAMPSSNVAVIEFTCNCDETMAKETGITSEELMRVLHCPMNH